MKNFRYFIFGALFVAAIIPIITAGVEIILTWCEAIKSKISLKITKYGSQMQKIAMDMEDCGGPAHQIGFVIDTNEEAIDEDDEL